MIGAISPCVVSVEQSLNTLRYTALVREFGSGPEKRPSETPKLSALQAAAAQTPRAAPPVAAAASKIAVPSTPALPLAPPPTVAKPEDNKPAVARPAQTPRLRPPSKRRASLIHGLTAHHATPLHPPSTARFVVNLAPLAPSPPSDASESPPQPPDATARTSTDSSASLPHCSEVLTSPLLSSPIKGAPLATLAAPSSASPPPPAVAEPSPPPPPPPEPPSSRRSFGQAVGGFINNLIAGSPLVGAPPPMGGLSAPPATTPPEGSVPPKAPREAWAAESEGKENMTSPQAPKSGEKSVVTSPTAPKSGEKGEKKRRGSREKRSSKSIAKASGAVFDAHRTFITSCVEQLEVHTFMLSQAEAKPSDAKQLEDYVGCLDALLRERQAALSTLQAQLDMFRVAIAPKAGA